VAGAVVALLCLAGPAIANPYVYPPFDALLVPFAAVMAVAEAFAIAVEAWAYRRWLGASVGRGLWAAAVANVLSFATGLAATACIRYYGWHWPWTPLMAHTLWLPTFLLGVAVEAPCVACLLTPPRTKGWQRTARSAGTVALVHVVSWPLTMLLAYCIAMLAVADGRLTHWLALNAMP
jgi:hypothetical protein